MINDHSAEGVFIDFARSVLNNEKPHALPESITADEIFSIGLRQDMAPVTFCALNALTPKPESEHWGQWQQQFLDDCMRSEIQMSEYHRLVKYLCSNGVRIIPLKGCVIKDLYPAPNLRVMCDVDLLFDGVTPRELSDLMKAFGYSSEKSEVGYHDVFHKKPCMNIEMHKELEAYNSKYKAVLQDLFDKAVEDVKIPNLFHMKPEDLYIHAIVHAAKHFKGTGLGIRPIGDIYILNQSYSGSWDSAYIAGQLQSVGLTQFEKKIREVAFAFFGEEKKAVSEAELMFFFRGGTYGNFEDSVKWVAAASGKPDKKYILRKIFAPLDDMKAWFPILQKYPWLYPFMMVYRWFDRLLHRTGRVKAVFSLNKTPEGEIERLNSIFEDFGLN